MQTLLKITFVAVISFVLSVGAAYSADSKIGIVDLHKVFEESVAGKSAKEEIQKEGKRMESELKKKGEELEALKNKLEKEIMVMGKDKREEKERDFRIKVGDFKALQKKYASDLKEREGHLLKRFQDNFFKLVQEVGKKNGYLMIVEKVGVLYYPDSIDITNELIKEYNKRYGR